MTVLITGGAGNTGLKLAQLLHDAGHSSLLASRSAKAPAPFKGVKFDWFDKTTFENPFNVDPSIESVYLVFPQSLDALTPMKPFLELAVSKGVKRFVLLSSVSVPKGGMILGKVHEYLDNQGLDYVVLRPSWFMENFGAAFWPSITVDNSVFSTAKDARIPFIAGQDIAQAAFDALTVKKVNDRDIYVLGPELLSYGEVAALLSDVLGRKITYSRLSREESVAKFTALGLASEYAEMLIDIEKKDSEGESERTFNDDHAKHIGKISLRQYFEENKDVWKPKPE